MATSSGQPPSRPPQKAGGPLARFFDEVKAVSENVRVFLTSALGEDGPGQLYEAARHIALAGGKMLRPFLAIKACEIVGGRVEEAYPVAAAVELLHNFTLVHDDIMDDDRVRRGLPTVHVKWGVPVAIVAGDLLFAKVYQTVIRSLDKASLNPQGTVAVLGRLTEAAISICEGQILDLTFPALDEVKEEDYIHMIGKKTACLFKAAAEVGAIVGGGSEAQVAALGRFAHLSGLAFQIVDDILGITSSEEALGKPVGSDLKEGKKTLIVIHALRNADPEGRRLIRQALGSADVSREAVAGVRSLMQSLGSIDYAYRKAKGYAQAALSELKAFEPGEARDALSRFAELVVEREF